MHDMINYLRIQIVFYVRAINRSTGAMHFTSSEWLCFMGFHFTPATVSQGHDVVCFPSPSLYVQVSNLDQKKTAAMSLIFTIVLNLEWL
jgi:hypothetical protein